MLNYDMQLFYTKYLDDIRAAPVPDSLADCWAVGLMGGLALCKRE